MRRREDSESPGERPTWLDWLTGVLTDLGYDVKNPRGGGRAKLARDTNLSASIVARLMDGQAPSYESLLAIARGTGIPLTDLLVRTGRATEDDFSIPGANIGQIAVSSGKPLTPEELAAAAGVPEGDRDWFVTMIRRLRLSNSSDGDSATGGAAAEG
ncbi:hypothetical protein [Streptomyces alboflavus]|uniref:hypothetical protein n=1 Tax=Streptomyces alboflavus TaxID=67267 RepID=UPI000F658226|nr:hypothetical protein [Streptomyces alboflavus]